MKNYAAAVPLVGDLRSPAMRPRHWEALMQATKASCLCNLLNTKAPLCSLPTGLPACTGCKAPSWPRASRDTNHASQAVHGASLPTVRWFLTVQVTFEIGASFTLGDLLRLELHKFEDEVVEIVDRSQKEEKLELVSSIHTCAVGQ